jgi:hypothetical protein
MRAAGFRLPRGVSAAGPYPGIFGRGIRHRIGWEPNRNDLEAE